MALVKANDKYRSQLRATWVADPPDTSLLVKAVPANVPTIVTVGYGTDLETVFRVEGKSGDSSSNYALTGVTRLKGANQNLPENTAVNCLNHEEFFNQYLQTIDWLDNDYAATIDLDLDVSTRHRMTLTDDATLTVSNPSSGQGFIVRILQDGTGGHTITWFDGISWAYGYEPSLTTTANKADLFVFVCTAITPTPTFDGFVVGQSL